MIEWNDYYCFIIVIAIVSVEVAGMCVVPIAVIVADDSNVFSISILVVFVDDYMYNAHNIKSMKWQQNKIFLYRCMCVVQQFFLSDVNNDCCLKS